MAGAWRRLSSCAFVSLNSMAGTPALVQRVVVVGGGIGGLATGLALLRRGVDVRVVERAREYRAGVGAGFGLSPNGYAAWPASGCARGRT